MVGVDGPASGSCSSHSSASDPKLAALEQAVSERNVLSSQNSQLWKLIEKDGVNVNIHDVYPLKDVVRATQVSVQ